jgi:UDP-N-acetylglucosamine 2-epimerase (non-hydrolysing)
VDTPDQLQALTGQLKGIAERLPLVFPVHPRTRKNLEDFGLWQALRKAPGLHVIEPLGYVEFMNLVCGASLTITDSGGLQEETTYLGIPCLTLRTTTERPITLTEGTNRLVSTVELVPAVDQILAGQWPHGRKPQLWDGKTATRVAADIHRRLVASSSSDQEPEGVSESSKQHASGHA